jgi:hypothetical protein
MVDRPRYDCDLRFPDHAFIPGRMPHPRRQAENAGTERPCDDRADPLDAPSSRVDALRRGLDLFNHGYFWEAHEAWEGPWQAMQRESGEALHLQALIRLAAAALKLVMEEPRGVAAHAAWCRATFARLERSQPAVFAGGPSSRDLLALCERLLAKREALLEGPPERLETILVLPVPE